MQCLHQGWICIVCLLFGHQFMLSIKVVSRGHFPYHLTSVLQSIFRFLTCAMEFRRRMFYELSNVHMLCPAETKKALITSKYSLNLLLIAMSTYHQIQTTITKVYLARPFRISSCWLIFLYVNSKRLPDLPQFFENNYLT